MRKQLAPLVALLVSACGVSKDSSPRAPVTGNGGTDFVAASTPVPKALCGPGSIPEAGLQGQVPSGLRAAGFPGFQCNLELVGQFQGEGASWQHAWYGDCSYYGTKGDSAQANLGVVVVDAADSSNPVATDYLDTAAMRDPWESLKVNQKRGLLAGVQQPGPGFSIYDVKTDCRHPQLLADVTFAGVEGHEGDWAPDGQTYYGEDIGTSNYYPIDVSDPAKPALIMQWTPPGGSHGLSISDDGTRGYFVRAGAGLVPAGAAYSQDTGPTYNGLVLADTSEIQQRRPNPGIRVISEAYFADGSAAQHTIPVTIGGKPYVIFVDELGSGGLGDSAATSAACAAGLSPFGMARIFSIEDETRPFVVSKLMLEIHDPANCAEVINDSSGSGVFAYDTHYCGVDRRDGATALACGHFESGLRVFDIRDPYHPREIAYYNPPNNLARQGALPGSNRLGAKDVDWASSMPRFRADRGEIWFTSQDGGFQIVRFTNGSWPFKE